MSEKDSSVLSGRDEKSDEHSTLAARLRGRAQFFDEQPLEASRSNLQKSADLFREAACHIEEKVPPKLWLWRNGPKEFWAFRHLYPCMSPGGDPCILGEPAGYALVKPSFSSDPREPSPLAAPAEGEWLPKTAAPQVQDGAGKAPTIDEMRCVASYMAETMGLHSAAGKLSAKADALERVVEELMEMKR